MAGTAVIGRVSVRVWPDTSGFKRELKRKLEGIDAVVKIPVEPDGRGAERKLRQIYRELQRQVQKIEIPVDLEKKSLQRMKDQLRDAFKDVAKVKVKLDRDSLDKLNDDVKDSRQKLTIDTDLRIDKDKLDKDLDDVSKKAKRKVKVEMELDEMSTIDLLDKAKGIEDNLRKLRRVQVDFELDEEGKRRVQREIRDLEDDLEDIKAEIGVEANTFGAARQLQWVSRDRFVDLFVRVNKASLAAAASALSTLSGVTGVKNALKDIGDFIKNIAQNAPKVAVLGTAVSGLALQFAAAAVNTLSLAGSLAEVAGIAPLLPALLGGIGTSILTIVLAMRDFQSELPDVVEGWKGLQKIVSDNFWERAADPIREMSNEVLPAFETGMAKVSRSMGNFFSAVAAGLQGILKPKVDTMFENLATAIDIASAAAGPLVGIITTLGNTGSQYLPAMATWFKDVTTQFDNFLRKADESGELEAFIDRGIRALENMWRVAKGVSRTLSGLAKAALKAGGATLDDFADSWERVADKVNSSNFQNKLIGVFNAILKGADNVGKKAGPALEKMIDTWAKSARHTLPQIGNAFGDLLGGIAEALSDPVFTRGMEDLWDGIADGMKRARPYFKDIGAGFGVLASIGGELARDVLPLVADVLGTIGKGLKNNKQPLVEFADKLGDFARKLWEDGLKDAVLKLIDNLPELARTFENIMDAVEPLIEPIGDLIESALDLFEAWQKIQNAVQPEVFGFLADRLGEVLDAVNFLLDPIRRLFQYLADENGGMAKFKEGMQIIKDLLGTMLLPFQQVSDWVKKLGDGFNAFSTDKAREQLENFANKLKGLVDKVNPLNIGKRLGQLLADGVKSKEGANASAARGIGDRIKKVWDAVNPASIGKRIGERLKNGIDSTKSANAQTARGIGDRIKEIWNGVNPVPIGQKIGRGLRNGIKSMTGAVRDAARNIRDRIEDTYNNAPTLLEGEGGQIGRGLARGIRGTAGAIADVVRSIRDRIDSIMSYPDLLQGEGTSIGAGFARGLRSQRSNAYDAGRGLKQAARDGASGGNAFGAGSSLGHSFAAGVRSAVGAAYSAGRALANAAQAGANSRGRIGPSLLRSPASSGTPSFARSTASASAGGVTVNQHNYYPVAENTAQATNKALQTAAMFGA